jgi:hypothetical protein
MAILDLSFQSLELSKILHEGLEEMCSPDATLLTFDVTFGIQTQG